MAEAEGIASLKSKRKATPLSARKLITDFARKVVDKGGNPDLAIKAVTAAVLVSSPEESEAVIVDKALNFLRQQTMSDPLELKPTTQFRRGERKTAKRVTISEADKGIIAQSAAKNKDIDPQAALNAYRDWKRRHPPSEWVQPELSMVKVNKNGSYKFVFKSPMYAFDKDPLTGKQIKVGSPKYNKLRKNVADEIISYIDRAANDPTDAAAAIVMDNAGWYKNVEARLRNEYGTFSEMMSDLLGATSPNTPVATNFNFSKQILGSFARGDFDDLMAGFADKLQRRYDLEDEAAEYLADQRAAGRTMAAAREDAEYRSLMDEADRISKEIQDNRNTIKQPGTQTPENPQGKNFGINSYGAMVALADKFRARRVGQAPKAKNFAGNLAGTSTDATIDVWAARNLRKHSGRKAIPSSAEQGVTGSIVDADNFRSGQEFGFAQEVLRDVTDDVNAHLKELFKDSPEKYNPLQPRDVQALQWFIEKDNWTQKGWTSKTGEGGSFEQMLDLDPTEAQFLGLSRDQSRPYQERDFTPTKAEMEQTGKKILADASTDPDVVTFKAPASRGVYAEGKNYFPETAMDIEIVVPRDTYSADMLLAATRQAVEDQQHSWFFARRIDPALGAANKEKFTVGTEVYFDSPKSVDDPVIDDIEQFLKKEGVPAYTLAVDARDSNKAIGIRFLDVPQFYENAEEFVNMSTKDYTSHVNKTLARHKDIGDELTKEFGSVKAAEPGYYDVNIKTLEESEAILEELRRRPGDAERLYEEAFEFKPAQERFKRFAGSVRPYYIRPKKGGKGTGRDGQEGKASVRALGPLAGIGALGVGIQELGKDALMAVLEPFGQASGASLERRFNPEATPESIAQAAERGRAVFEYEPESEVALGMKKSIQEGIQGLGSYLMDPENVGPAQFLTQKVVVPTLETLAPVQEAAQEGIISLIGGDDPLAQAEAEAGRPIVEAGI